MPPRLRRMRLSSVRSSSFLSNAQRELLRYPEGWGYTQFCAHYQRWLGAQDVVMRLTGHERTGAACDRALAVGAVSYSSVKSILAEGVDRVPLRSPSLSRCPAGYSSARRPVLARLGSDEKGDRWPRRGVTAAKTPRHSWVTAYVPSFTSRIAGPLRSLAPLLERPSS